MQPSPAVERLREGEREEECESSVPAVIVRLRLLSPPPYERVKLSQYITQLLNKWMEAHRAQTRRLSAAHTAPLSKCINVAVNAPLSAWLQLHELASARVCRGDIAGSGPLYPLSLRGRTPTLPLRIAIAAARSHRAYSFACMHTRCRAYIYTKRLLPQTCALFS